MAHEVDPVEQHDRQTEAAAKELNGDRVSRQSFIC